MILKFTMKHLPFDKNWVERFFLFSEELQDFRKVSCYASEQSRNPLKIVND